MSLEVADVFYYHQMNQMNQMAGANVLSGSSGSSGDYNSCYSSYLLFLNDRASAEVEFRRERYAVHFLFGFVLEGDFLFGDNGAW